MAVKLRLTRRGKKKQPFYRIVAIDSRAKRDGKYIDKIGHYNPLTNPADVVIDEEKVFYWLKNGATPSDTVKNLLSKQGLWMKWSLIKQGADESKIEEELKKWEVQQLERQKRLEAIAAQKKREQQKAKEVEKEESAAAEAVEAEQPVAEAAETEQPAAEEAVKAEEPAAEAAETEAAPAEAAAEEPAAEAAEPSAEETPADEEKKEESASE